MSLPLPNELAEALRQPGTGASLCFDRCFDGYDDSWTRALPPGAKATFLRDFVESYDSRKGRYKETIARRGEVLRQLGAEKRDLFSTSRLAIGLGLPSPIETGFLFDRRTGAPYLPGSSVKGLARAAALLVAAGELPSDSRNFWTPEKIAQLFGPETEAAAGPAKGQVVFYDAFPCSWPRLEPDVLTPHHRSYYADSNAASNVPPADWDEPVPVPFLTVAPGTKFAFYVKGASGDVAEVLALLQLGLDWLGIGAKKSAGYGVFGLQPVRPRPQLGNHVASPIVSQPSTGRPPERKPSPRPRPHGDSLWNAAKVQLEKGEVTATHGSKKATGELRQLPSDVVAELKKGKPVRFDVIVRRGLGNDLMIVALTPPEKP